MDVSVSNLRSHLSAWLERVQDGEDVVVTDRGTPVARIVPMAASTLLADLEKEGLIARPSTSDRPRAGELRRVSAERSVAQVVTDQRD